MQVSARQPVRSNTRSTGNVERAYKFADLSEYSFKQRFIIRLADLAFYGLIRLVGLTLRFEVIDWDNYERATRDGTPIFAFWHNRIFSMTYWWRNRGIVVLTSKSFDGEYIARFIQRLGYGAVRGSSTRGGVGAVVELVRLMRGGCSTAFTVDGPTGPPYVAKMGPVLLAKKAGHPIVPMTISLDHYWTAPTWDSFQVPLPFSRARLYMAPPVYVPADANDDTLRAKLQELQHALDDINRRK